MTGLPTVTLPSLLMRRTRSKVDLTRGGGQEFDLEGVACSDAVLLTAGFQNSVHKNFPPTGGRGRNQTGAKVSTPVFAHEVF